MRTERPIKRLSTVPAAIALLALSAGSVGGCADAALVIAELFGVVAEPAPRVAIVFPLQGGNSFIGATVFLEWADIAVLEGTVITIEALEIDANDEIIRTELILSGRDALADGDADIFEFDSSDQPPGRYQYRITISSPDGQSQAVVTDAIIELAA